MLALIDQSISFAAWSAGPARTKQPRSMQSHLAVPGDGRHVCAWWHGNVARHSARPGRDTTPASLSRGACDGIGHPVEPYHRGDVDPDLDDFAMHRLIARRLCFCTRARGAQPSCESGHSRIACSSTLVLAVLLTTAIATRRVSSHFGARRAVGRGIRRTAVACFALGWATLARRCCRPSMHSLSTSFAVHMMQHELLMVVAAPLIVFGRPMEAWAWALPATARCARAAVRESRPLHEHLAGAHHATGRMVVSRAVGVDLAPAGALS